MGLNFSTKPWELHSAELLNSAAQAGSCVSCKFTCSWHQTRTTHTVRQNECICRFVLTKFAGAKDHLGQPACKEHRKKKHTNSDTAILQGFRATNAHSFDRVLCNHFSHLSLPSVFWMHSRISTFVHDWDMRNAPKIGPCSKLQFQNSEVFLNPWNAPKQQLTGTRKLMEILEPCCEFDENAPIDQSWVSAWTPSIALQANYLSLEKASVWPKLLGVQNVPEKQRHQDRQENKLVIKQIVDERRFLTI